MVTDSQSGQGENNKTNENGSLPISRRGAMSRLVSLFLFIGFWTGIAYIASFYFLPFIQIKPGFIASALALVGILVAASVIFMVRVTPTGGSEARTLDFQTLIIVVFGTASLLAAGGITALSLKPPLLAGAILGILIIYVITLFRIIRFTFRSDREIEKIRSQYQDLIKIERAKTEFMTVTSHQLNTPLAEVRWGLESLLSAEGIEKENRDMISMILKGVNRIVETVADINKALSQKDKTATDYASELKTVQLAELILEIVNVLGGVAREKNVTLSFEGPEQEIFLGGNKDKLTSAIKNVIDNAIRYTPGGRVIISLRKEGASAIIRVQDTGIGILPEDTPLMFKKFFRGKNALLLQPDGSGLGLFTAREIIENAGGKIDFISTPERGTILDRKAHV